MKLLEWLTGSKAPDRNVAPLAPDEVRAAILAVNQPDKPFEVRPGRPDEGELVAEWRIVDAHWQHLFGDAGLTKVSKVLMRLDPANNAVRSLDQAWSVAWNAGVPRLTVEASSFRGQQWSREASVSYGFNREGRFGRNYGYSFSTRTLKELLQRAVLGCGWTWRAVVSGPL